MAIRGVLGVLILAVLLVPAGCHHTNGSNGDTPKPPTIPPEIAQAIGTLADDAHALGESAAEVPVVSREHVERLDELSKRAGTIRAGLLQEEGDFGDVSTTLSELSAPKFQHEAVNALSRPQRTGRVAEFVRLAAALRETPPEQ